MRGLLLSMMLAAALAHAHSFEKGDLQIRHPWSRATAPGAKVGVAYMEFRNNGRKPERIVGASTPLARKVEMHITSDDGGVARMREVQSFEIPARQRLELRPGGGHFMLVDITRPLKKGERIPLTVRLEKGGELVLELEVQEIGSRHGHH